MQWVTWRKMSWHSITRSKSGPGTSEWRNLQLHEHVWRRPMTYTSQESELRIWSISVFHKSACPRVHSRVVSAQATQNLPKFSPKFNLIKTTLMLLILLENQLQVVQSSTRTSSCKGTRRYLVLFGRLISYFSTLVASKKYDAKCHRMYHFELKPLSYK